MVYYKLFLVVDEVDVEVVEEDLVVVCVFFMCLIKIFGFILLVILRRIFFCWLLILCLVRRDVRSMFKC